MYVTSSLARLRRSAALALLGAVVACSGPTSPPDGPAPAAVLLGGEPAVTRMDPATIGRAEVVGDQLRLSVRYGGGCREHRFSLRSSEVFLESDPVQTHLQLLHDAGGDNCRALIGKELVFDLTPLKQAYQRQYNRTRGTIVLHLHAPGAQDPVRPPLRYEF